MHWTVYSSRLPAAYLYGILHIHLGRQVAYIYGIPYKDFFKKMLKTC